MREKKNHLQGCISTETEYQRRLWGVGTRSLRCAYFDALSEYMPCWSSLSSLFYGVSSEHMILLPLIVFLILSLGKRLGSDYPDMPAPSYCRVWDTDAGFVFL